MTSPDPSADWLRLDSLFQQLLDHPRLARRARLEELCPEEPELREVLRGWLDADETEIGFLDRPALEHLADLEEIEADGPDDEPEMPVRLGAWRVLSELGRGGMGVVYLAERADGAYDQQVAVKLVKRGVDTDEVLARFRRERQILARLEHPGIARLVDGGVSDDGRPFLVMERVEGESILDYCDRRRLGIGDRLRLFLRVCAAVEHAHRALVVHRDLKPSNILVTGDGQVKLLDFGIAKLLTPDDGEGGTALTRGTSRVFTPEYAAPEQLMGEPVSTATDVYALGGVLYELLTGHVPEPERSIVDGTVASRGLPTRPAKVVLPTGPRRDDATTAAAARSTSPRRLSRRLEGDLDAIVLRALRPEPHRRYPTADALRRDLVRALEGRPVEARPESVAYRATRFVRRHRVGVAASALTVLALVIGLGVALWKAREAREQARRAEEVRRFLVGLFEASSPENARGEETTARELLERGTARIRTELGDEPELRREMLRLLGGLHRELGLFEQAEDLLEEATEDGGERVPPADVAQGLVALGRLRAEQGRHDEAELVFRRSLALREERFGARSAPVSESLSGLAGVANDAGRHVEAAEIYRRVLALDRSLHGRESREVAGDLNDLAWTLRQLDELDEAEQLHREALAIRRSLFEEPHPDIALSLANLGVVRAAQGEYADAEALHREALAMRRLVFGPDHPDVAISLDALGAVLEDVVRYDEASDIYEEALTIRREKLGETHRSTIATVNNLAVVRFRMEDYDGAAGAFRRAAAAFAEALGSEHPSTLTALNNLGRCLLQLGRLDESRRLLSDVLERRRAVRGERHSDVGQTLNNLGLLEVAAGDLRAAERRFREAESTYREVLPEGHPRLAEVLVGLGTALFEQGRAGEAELAFTEALEIRRERLGAQDPRTTEAELWLGRARAALTGG